MRIFLVVILFFILNFYSFSQNKYPFSVGENVNYEIYYNVSFVWMNAGKVYFKIENKTINGKDYFWFRSRGTTYKSYDLFYKVRDTYESIASKKTLKPIAFVRNSYEGGYSVNNRYIFDYKNKKIYTKCENSKTPLHKDTLKIKKNIYDALSMIYKARTLDFSKYKSGDKIPLTMIIDNEIYDLYIRYLGKEKIKTHGEEKEFMCNKFSVLLIEGSIFSGGEDMTVWVSDDKRKIPILIEAKILVGSIKAYYVSG